ncbi:MAG: hypothetical protein L0K68_12300 [Tetragenococcus koreensis]|nr:hypothetical protein [Tetragenococcus koreensis]
MKGKYELDRRKQTKFVGGWLPGEVETREMKYDEMKGMRFRVFGAIVISLMKLLLGMVTAC